MIARCRGARYVPLPMSPKQPERETLPQGARVLILRLSALGDVIFALETLRSLKAERPDLRVDFMVEDRWAAILRDHPDIDALIVFPRRHKLRYLGHLLRLRRRRYDLLLDLHGILKSAVQVWFAKARLKVGYAPPGAKEGAHLAYHRRVALPQPLPHRADRGLFLLRELGLRGAPAQPILGLPATAPQLFHESQGPRVLLHPGTSAFAAFKRWPAERFASLARQLLDEGMQVALSFGPGEQALANSIAEAAEGVQLVDGKELGLLGLAAGMQEADVVVAADTGPLHIAAAVGCRCVALFGPKDHLLYGPRGRGHEVLFQDVPCRPCKRRDCASPQCILGLEVGNVHAAVHRILDAQPA